jgi:predicted sugar kinase
MSSLKRLICRDPPTKTLVILAFAGIGEVTAMQLTPNLAIVQRKHLTVSAETVAVALRRGRRSLLA